MACAFKTLPLLSKKIVVYEAGYPRQTATETAAEPLNRRAVGSTGIRTKRQGR